MSFTETNVGRFDRISLLMVGVMICAFLYLAFGPNFGSGFATLGALLVFPFALGFLVTQGGGYFSWRGCLGLPLALMAGALVLVYAGLEGLICVVMVMPIWIIAALGGGLASFWLKYTDQPDDECDNGSSRLNSAGIALLPFLLILAENAQPPEWQNFSIERSVIIDRTPAEIWPLLVSIPDINTGEGKKTLTHDWLGVPRPSSATLIRRDGQSIRLARWGSSVRFEERIDAFEKDRALKWTFAFPDDSISQQTDRHISPDGPILKVLRGEYRLSRLDNGKTRLTLITTYASRTRVDWYLQWWGDKLLGDVQENVLTIIAQRAG